MRRESVIFLLMSFLFACQTQQKENTTSDKKEEAAKVEASVRTNMSFLNDYNALEALFTNDNWLLPDKKDSSYLYVSRLGSFQVKTYEYKMVKGDSAKVTYGLIQTEGDKITWNFNGQKLYLANATRARAVWTIAGSDSLRYEFLRLDNKEASLVYPDKKKVVMKKMLPFSLFLIRSRYDFLNGTKYAFDTIQFNRKGK
jgi:hypothetical protein